MGFSAKALLDAAAHHHKLEAEIEEIEEKRREMDEKVQRLRKQKKMWYEKMTRAIQRGFASVEEMEREEEEIRRERLNPVIKDGGAFIISAHVLGPHADGPCPSADFQYRAPREFQPSSPGGPYVLSTF